MQAGTLQDVWFWLLPLCVAGYLMGSISSAILVCRLFGYPDPRTEGSNNPGATNVLRIGGKPAAALTLLGDVLKGVIPVVLAHYLGMGPFVAALVGTFAFLGHLFPVFFHFQGGKGVAMTISGQIACNESEEISIRQIPRRYLFHFTKCFAAINPQI